MSGWNSLRITYAITLPPKNWLLPLFAPFGSRFVVILNNTRGGGRGVYVIHEQLANEETRRAMRPLRKGRQLDSTPSKTSQFDAKTFGKWLPLPGPNIVMKITIVVKTEDLQEPRSPGDRR